MQPEPALTPKPRRSRKAKPGAPRKARAIPREPIETFATPGATAYVVIPVNVRERFGETVVVFGDNFNRRIPARDLLVEDARFPGTFKRGKFR